jgi:hypothetical protein
MNIQKLPELAKSGVNDNTMQTNSWKSKVAQGT